MSAKTKRYHRLLDAYYKKLKRDKQRSHEKYGFPLVIKSGVCASDPYISHAPGIIIDNLPADLTGKSVLDMGCGSGVLSITAAYRGAHVTACDYDPMAVNLTNLNVENNPDITGRVNTVLSNIFSEIPSFQKFDLVLANLWFLSAENRKTSERDKENHIGSYYRYFNDVCGFLKQDGVACLTSGESADVTATEEIITINRIKPHKLTVKKPHFDGKIDMNWHLYSFNKKRQPATFAP